MKVNEQMHPFKLIEEAVKPDAQKRISVAKVKSEDDILYNVYENDLGQVLLDPVKTIPTYEMWLFKNKEALESVQRGLRDSAEGRTEYLGSFAEFLDEEDEE